jgi:hypothetical protein
MNRQVDEDRTSPMTEELSQRGGQPESVHVDPSQ